MPARPGKYEGEGAETFLLDRAALDGWMDDQVGSVDYRGWYALFKGTIGSDAIPQEWVDEAKDYGYTQDEVSEAFARFSTMAGAIICADSNGFVTSAIFEEPETLRSDWQITCDDCDMAEDYS